MPIAIPNPGIISRPLSAPLVEVAPAAMDFTRQAVISSFDLQPSAQLWVNEAFASDTGQFATFTEGTSASFAISGGYGVLSASASAARDIYAYTGSAIGIPNFFISVDVVSRSGSGGTYDNLGVGIGKDSNNFLICQYDRNATSFRAQGKFAGTNYFRLFTTVTLTPPFSMALSMHGTNYAIWYNTGSGWVRTGDESLSWWGRDTRTQDWTGWKPLVGLATNGNNTWNLDNLKAGRFGALKMRDFSPITDEAGRVVDFSGKVRLLATASGPYLGQSFATVVEFDPNTLTLSQIGTLAVARDSGIWNDHAGHIVKLDNGNYRVLLSTWGNGFGGTLQVRSVETSTNITTGSHNITGTSQLSLPNIPVSPGTGGAYDPYAVKFGGTWYVAYSVVNPTSFSGENFYCALATTSDFSSFTGVGADTSQKINEGPRLVPTNSDLWVVTGGRGEQIIYDETLTQVASALDVDVALYNGTNTQPWPAMFSFGNTVYMVTFDGTQFNGTGTAGNVWIYTAPRYV